MSETSPEVNEHLYKFLCTLTDLELVAMSADARKVQDTETLGYCMRILKERAHYLPTPSKMMRVRFKVALQDYRPVYWPKHPYWCTSEDEYGNWLVSYADNLHYIYLNWPEATEVDVIEENVQFYTFTDRFPKPDWFKH